MPGNVSGCVVERFLCLSAKITLAVFLRLRARLLAWTMPQYNLTLFYSSLFQYTLAQRHIFTFALW